MRSVGGGIYLHIRFDVIKRADVGICPYGIQWVTL